MILLDDDDGEDVQNNQLGKQDPLSQSKGSKLEDKLKFNMFNVFCALLRGINITPWKIYALTAIEFIQFLSFSFHSSVSI